MQEISVTMIVFSQLVHITEYDMIYLQNYIHRLLSLIHLKNALLLYKTICRDIKKLQIISRHDDEYKNIERNREIISYYQEYLQMARHPASYWRNDRSEVQRSETQSKDLIDIYFIHEIMYYVYILTNQYCTVFYI